jgi:hypothetical protein
MPRPRDRCREDFGEARETLFESNGFIGIKLRLKRASMSFDALKAIPILEFYTCPAVRTQQSCLTGPETWFGRLVRVAQHMLWRRLCKLGSPIQPNRFWRWQETRAGSRMFYLAGRRL